MIEDVLGQGTVPVWSDATAESGKVVWTRPLRLNGDGVVTLWRKAAPGEISKRSPKPWRRNPGMIPVLVLLIEHQRRPDKMKRWVWPVYQALLRFRWRAPVELMVICPNASMVEWAGQPVPLGLGSFGSVIRPIAIGPEGFPAVTDPEEAAAAPSRSLVSVIMRGDDPECGQAVLEAFANALSQMNPQDARVLIDTLYAVEPDLRPPLEAIMIDHKNYRYKSDYFKQLREEALTEGEARGEARALLEILTAHRIDIPADARERITSCRDTTLLSSWLHRVPAATSIDQILRG